MTLHLPLVASNSDTTISKTIWSEVVSGVENSDVNTRLINVTVEMDETALLKDGYTLIHVFGNVVDHRGDFLFPVYTGEADDNLDEDNPYVFHIAVMGSPADQILLEAHTADLGN